MVAAAFVACIVQKYARPSRSLAQITAGPRAKQSKKRLSQPVDGRYDVSRVIQRQEKPGEAAPPGLGRLVQEELNAPLLQIRDGDAGPPEETGSQKALLINELVQEGKRWKKEAARLSESLSAVEAERDAAVAEAYKLRLRTQTAADLEAKLKHDVGEETTRRQMRDLFGKDVEYPHGRHYKSGWWLRKEGQERAEWHQPSGGESPTRLSPVPGAGATLGGASAASSARSGRPYVGLPSTERWAAEERAREAKSGFRLV